MVLVVLCTAGAVIVIFAYKEKWTEVGVIYISQ